MKLEEIKGEEALDVAADLLGPISQIVKKEEIQKVDRSDKLAFVQTIMRSCKKEIIEIFAILDRVPVEKYRKEFNLSLLPKKIIALFKHIDYTISVEI
jgi:hypothetical protein